MIKVAKSKGKIVSFKESKKTNKKSNKGYVSFIQEMLDIINAPGIDWDYEKHPENFRRIKIPE